jgi:hypothetical protein
MIDNNEEKALTGWPRVIDGTLLIFKCFFFENFLNFIPIVFVLAIWPVRYRKRNAQNNGEKFIVTNMRNFIVYLFFLATVLIGKKTFLFLLIIKNILFS